MRLLQSLILSSLSFSALIHVSSGQGGTFGFPVGAEDSSTCPVLSASLSQYLGCFSIGRSGDTATYSSSSTTPGDLTQLGGGTNLYSFNLGNGGSNVFPGFYVGGTYFTEYLTAYNCR